MLFRSVPVAKADPDWRNYVGNYVDASWFDTEVMIYKDQLVMNSYSFPPEDQPDSEIKILTPVSKNTFRMNGPNGNGELVVFEMDKNNKVVRIKVGENYIFPKKWKTKRLCNQLVPFMDPEWYLSLFNILSDSG